MSGAIWLASYPKSGNTWARLALRSLQLGGDSIELTDISRFGTVMTRRSAFETELSIDAGLLSIAELERLRPELHDQHFGASTIPRLCKVHDRWFRTQEGRPVFDSGHTHAALYLLRDPRDVAVSWARFQNRPIDWAISFLASPDAKLAAPASGNNGHIDQPLGTWSDHVVSWIDDSNLEPLVIRYEDMHADLAGTLGRIARHIGWAADEDAINGAVAATEFSRLADLEDREGFKEKPDAAQRFFVSGRVGGWRDILSANQAERILRDHRAVMERFGYT